MRKTIGVISILLAGCANPNFDSQGFAAQSMQIMQQYYQNQANIVQQRQIQPQQPTYTPSQPTYIQQGKCYQDAFANVRCY